MASSATRTITLKRHGSFSFRLGVDLEALEPLIRGVVSLHRLFKQLPILPEIASELDHHVIVTSIRGTDTIEGGTFTEEEIERVLESPETAREERERRITNLRRAYERMEGHVAAHRQGGSLPITEAFIRELHQIISEDLGDDNYRPGLYRDNPKGRITKVGDKGHGVYKPPQAHVDIKLLMETFVDWLNTPPVNTFSPLVRAPLTHYYFERIHPFQDGNGRVGRILEKAILIAAGYRRAAYGLDHYYLEHVDDYFSVFNQARKQEAKRPETCNQVFVRFVLEGLRKTTEHLHQQICHMLAHILNLSILGELLQQKRINYRQHAILDHLLRQHQPTSEAELKSQSWYTALYKRLSPATKSRDWKHLRQADLIGTLPDGRIRPGPAFGYPDEGLDTEGLLREISPSKK